MADSFLSTFMSNVSGNFARSFMFYAKIISNPVGIDTLTQKFLVKSTVMPDSTLEEIMVPFQGMSYKMGGIHTYADWECTFNADNSFDLRQKLLDWQDLVHSAIDNVQGKPSDYFGTLEVEMINPFESGDQPTFTTTLYHAWPKVVGTISLDYGTKEVASFSTTWSLNWTESATTA